MTRALPGDRDTIAAIATPAGAGGVGIVRLSGPRSIEMLGRLTGHAGERFEDRRLVAGVVRDPTSGDRLDEVLCVVMRGPRSFTGEDVAEVHGHGGAVNMARLLRAALAAGARHAEPGEFTRRAFENGRLDLTRAEAVLGVIEASSERALRLAQDHLAGRLGDRIGELRRAGTDLLADVEARIDFPEEDLGPDDRASMESRAAGLARGCAALAATFDAGRALRDGIEVAICGPANAGKSSLFNRLIGAERALVAEEPGTTRDFLEARVVWSGVPVTLIDTAGRREAESEVERRGIDLGAQRARAADVELHLVAADAPERESDQVEGRDRRVVRVLSKGDRLAVGSRAQDGALLTSAKTGQGIEELVAMVLRTAGAGGLEEEGGTLLTSERQRAGVSRAADALDRAAAAVRTGTADEVVALEVREAVDSLAEVVGEVVGEEVLDALFARFCIGK